MTSPSTTHDAISHFADALRDGLDLISPMPVGAVEHAVEGELSSAFAVTALASAAVGAATTEVGAWIHGGSMPAQVDARLASWWYAASIRPSWTLPPTWDAVAGVYAASNGWVRLHTNAPHHRVAALGALAVGGDRDAVAARVATMTAAEVESAVVDAGGCAAEFRSLTDWAAHPQGASVAAEPLIWSEPGSADSGRPRAAGTATRPLSGVKVLDLTRVLAGPVATRFLAGWGADVLRIDPPDWDEANVVPEVTLGKRCARLDLRTEHDRAMLRDLMSEADVLVHGYRPDALERLGLGAQVRQEVRPGLVDVCLDAYGWTGPWSGRRGFDSLVQMSSGIAHEGMIVSGNDDPTPLPVQALDHTAGYVLAAAAVRGLRRRREQGVGTIARTSLARVGALLAGGPRGSFDAQLRGIDDADVSDHVETSVWGTARRVRPPATLDGVTMQWDHDAGPLGSAKPRW